MISKRLEKNERPIFPKKAVITAGMPYGNKNLHFGHIGGMFIHADIFARFLRDRIGKDNVIFVSGTDCYGSPILESYRKLKENGYNKTIEEYVKENHISQKKTLEDYKISLDLFGASAFGRSGEVHSEVSEEIFNILFKNGYIKKLSALQFYDEDKKTFLNGRQVIGKCPIAGCNSDKAYGDECSLGHQYMSSELINPISTLSGKKPILKNVDNWYFTLDDSLDIMKELNEFLKKNTNRRKFEIKAIDEFLKDPMIYVPKKYIDDLNNLEDILPSHKTINEENKSSITFIFDNLEDRDKAKEKLDNLNIHYTSGKTLVPFRLSGNISWGVKVPDKDDLKNLTFWVWPESLWAPISFIRTYLESIGENSKEWHSWWQDKNSMVYQFIGEDNIYFYSIAEMAILIGLKTPKGKNANISDIKLPHVVPNKHILFMDKKASSSSDVKPPMADELLNYYTSDQLRMHFMSLGLSSKSVGFKPQVYMKEDEKNGADPVLKEGNLLTNVFNRLIRSCFYTLQSLNENIPREEVSEKIKVLTEKAVFEYERHMYNQDFHRISYVLDDYIREINKYWVNNSKKEELKRIVLADCFYACKVIAILIHPIAPEGCEMFKDYLNISDELWNWDKIFEPLESYFEDGDTHKFKFLEPKVDFFEKMEHQFL
ncbi:MAG: class I tRNA ligase family protein [Clostridium sp.]|uniref:class I tRNA ligase family protein n=1 Tax=Clostridium sp. TaxID=1506 RepID=UPI0025BDB5B9|nr:class I tRNA ligase family protein [Clostridium sp.]MCF0148105.1 class I tRNA ligase family protein [Clostridium sp.]